MTKMSLIKTHIVPCAALEIFRSCHYHFTCHAAILARADCTLIIMPFSLFRLTPSSKPKQECIFSSKRRQRPALAVNGMMFAAEPADPSIYFLPHSVSTSVRGRRRFLLWECRHIISIWSVIMQEWSTVKGIMALFGTMSSYIAGCNNKNKKNCYILTALWAKCASCKKGEIHNFSWNAQQRRSIFGTWKRDPLHLFYLKGANLHTCLSPISIFTAYVIDL